MRWLIVTLMTLCCRSTTSLERERMIVWNVGQGSWATFVSQIECDHFDVGGEGRVPQDVKNLCAAKLNRVFISHMDWDHISHLSEVSRRFRSVCLFEGPRDLNMKTSAAKTIMLRLSICEKKQKREIEELSFNTTAKRSNDLSRIFSFRSEWIFPGDSPKSAEQKWASSAPRASRILVIGHHGSRTSTSDFLLQKLPNLKMTLASSRFRKYGHPHSEVRERLARHNLPLLITEEWGHLIFEL